MCFFLRENQRIICSQERGEIDIQEDNLPVFNIELVSLKRLDNLFWDADVLRPIENASLDVLSKDLSVESILSSFFRVGFQCVNELISISIEFLSRSNNAGNV